MNNNMIDSAAEIGTDVKIGYGTRIYGNVVIGNGVSVGDFCIIGHPSVSNSESRKTIIGERSVVRSHSIIYENTIIGNELETGHHVVIREGAIIGENLRVGNYSDIEGSCTIGDFVRMHSYVHVGKGTSIGSFVWLFSLITTMNDPLPPSNIFEPVTIKDMVTVCVNAQCMPGAVIGKGAFIASGAAVSGDVRPGVVIGSDGHESGPVSFMMHMSTRTRHPWCGHFSASYPERAQARIRELAAEIRALPI